MNSTLILIGLCVTVFGAGFMLLHVAAAGSTAYHRRFTMSARVRLEEAFVFINPNRVFFMSVAGALVAPLVLWWLTGSPLLPVAAFVLALVLPKIMLARMNKKRRLKMLVQLPDVLLMLGSSLRAGTSLQMAMELAIRETPAPLSQELGVAVQEQRLGLALEDSLESMANRLKLEEIELVVTAMNIARECGGNLAETLDRLANTLRAKAAMEGKIRSLTSQGKLQGIIVGLLPVFLMLALTYMQPEAMQPLYHTIPGWAVLGVIATLEIIGFLFIKKIVTIDV